MRCLSSRWKSGFRSRASRRHRSYPERVEGLLRSYEENEAQAAASQGRRPIWYGFLWDSLGIERKETNRGLQ